MLAMQRAIQRTEVRGFSQAPLCLTNGAKPSASSAWWVHWGPLSLAPCLSLCVWALSVCHSMSQLCHFVSQLSHCVSVLYVSALSHCVSILCHTGSQLCHSGSQLCQSPFVSTLSHCVSTLSLFVSSLSHCVSTPSHCVSTLAVTLCLSSLCLSLSHIWLCVCLNSLSITVFELCVTLSLCVWMLSLCVLTICHSVFELTCLQSFDSHRHKSGIVSSHCVVSVLVLCVVTGGVGIVSSHCVVSVLVLCVVTGRMGIVSSHCVVSVLVLCVVTGGMGSIQLCDSEETNERRRLPQRLPVQRQTQGRVFPESAQRTVQFTVLGLCYAPKVQEVLMGEQSCKGAISQITADFVLYCGDCSVKVLMLEKVAKVFVSKVITTDCLVCSIGSVLCPPKVQEILMAEEGCKAVCSKTSQWTVWLITGTAFCTRPTSPDCKDNHFQSHQDRMFGLPYWDYSAPRFQEILIVEGGHKAVCSKTSQWTVCFAVLGLFSTQFQEILMSEESCRVCVTKVITKGCLTCSTGFALI